MTEELNKTPALGAPRWMPDVMLEGKYAQTDYYDDAMSAGELCEAGLIFHCSRCDKVLDPANQSVVGYWPCVCGNTHTPDEILTQYEEGGE